MLRESDIDQIITTYKNRENIEKYSYVASLEEIKENDYNLNIPRYVDTFEEEEQIDLDKVAKSIIQIEKDMKDTDKLIAECTADEKIQIRSGAENDIVPLAAAACNLLGALERKLGHEKEARAAFRRALEMEPSFRLAKENLRYREPSSSPERGGGN